MDRRICFFGDSFVNGTGDPTCLGWTGRICAQAQRPNLELTYYNLGVRGETSLQIEQRWRLEATPRLVQGQGRLVFSFGVNDTTEEAGALRVEPADSLACLKRILQTAKLLYPLLVIGPPPIAEEAQNARIRKLSEAFKAVCESAGVPYLPVFPILKSSPIWMREVMAGDGAHPSAAGYSILADIVGHWSPWQEFL